MAFRLLAPSLAGFIVGTAFVLLFVNAFPISQVDGEVNENLTGIGRAYDRTISENITVSDQLTNLQTKIILDPAAFYGLIGAISGAILSPILVRVFEIVKSRNANKRIRKMIYYELNEYARNLKSISKIDADKASGSIILTPSTDVWEVARQMVEYGIKYYNELPLEKKAEVFDQTDSLDQVEKIYRSARFLNYTAFNDLQRRERKSEALELRFPKDETDNVVADLDSILDNDILESVKE